MTYVMGLGPTMSATRTEHYTNICAEIIADDDLRQSLVKSISDQLRRLYKDEVELSEIIGWANLGLAKAANGFDQRRLHGISENESRRIYAYLLQKGKNIAIDEMRSAREVGRGRGGRYYPARIRAQQMKEMPDDAYGGVVYDVLDVRSGNDPTPDLANIRELVNRVVQHLKGADLKVFKLAYVDGMTLADAARKLKVTTSRVYEVHEGLIRKVKALLRGSGR